MSWTRGCGLNYLLTKPYFSIEILTGSEINSDLHDGARISLGTPVGGLSLSTMCFGTIKNGGLFHLITAHDPFQ